MKGYCELIMVCAFYNDKVKIIGTHQMKEDMKEQICRLNSRSCARRMVYAELGDKSAIPDSLLPHESEKVPGIVENKSL